MNTKIINEIEITFTGKRKSTVNKYGQLIVMHEILCIHCKIPKLVSHTNLRYGKGLSHKSCSMRNVRKLDEDPIENSKRKVAAYYLMRIKVTIKQNKNKKSRVVLINENDVYKIIFNNCIYCGAEPYNYAPSYYNVKYNGIDRINNKLEYSIDNCAPCCIICNRAKNSLSEIDFNKWIDGLVQYQTNLKEAKNATKNEIYERGSDSIISVSLSSTKQEEQ